MRSSRERRFANSRWLAGTLIAPTLGVALALVLAEATPVAAPGGYRLGGPCKRVPAEGCCNDEVLYYCDRGRLRALDCRLRARCGWRKTFYDCNTAGSADPAGRYTRRCPFGAAAAPAPGRRPPRPDACGAITVEGCCDGPRLKYCSDGRLRVIDCGRNPSCGWRGVGQLYNCGTDGAADPSGKHPRACPKPRSKAG